MFTLFKLAGEGRAAARGRIGDTKKLGDKIWGVIWNALGRNPEELMRESFLGNSESEEFADYVRSEKASLGTRFLVALDRGVPADIPDELGGAAYRLLYKWLMAKIADSVTYDGGSFTWNDLDWRGISSDIEAYGALHRDDIKNYNRRNPAASLPTNFDNISSPAELRRIIAQVYPIVAEREQQRSIEHAKLKAAEGTQILHGTPISPEDARVGQRDLPLEERLRAQREDLVDGKLLESEWSVIIPDSIESSVYWGHGTEWCTARKNLESNYYSSYHKPANPLIIFMNGRTGHRYQFHYEKKHFKDSGDDDILNIKLARGLHELGRRAMHDKYKARPERYRNEAQVRSDALDNIDNPDKLIKSVSSAKFGEGEGAPELWADNKDVTLISDADGAGLHSSRFFDEEGAFGPAGIGESEEGRYIFWLKGGALHREDGPAIVGENFVKFYKNGVPVAGWGITGMDGSADSPSAVGSNYIEYAGTRPDGVNRYSVDGRSWRLLSKSGQGMNMHRMERGRWYFKEIHWRGSWAMGDNGNGMQTINPDSIRLPVQSLISRYSQEHTRFQPEVEKYCREEMARWLPYIEPGKKTAAMPVIRLWIKGG